VNLKKEKEKRGEVYVPAPRFHFFFAGAFFFAAFFLATDTTSGFYV
jgi:Na+-translocating ferredoxin:NAD+ oxidoreductase RnfD subunit